MRGGVEISRKGLVGSGDDGKQRKFVAPHRKAVLGQKLKGYRAGDGEKQGEIQQVEHGGGVGNTLDRSSSEFLCKKIT